MRIAHPCPDVGYSHPLLTALPRRRLRPEETAELVAAVMDEPTLWRAAVHHDPVERWHARLLWTPDVEVYVLGWTAEQDTRLHDHGGSVGAFSVVAGSLFEERGCAGSATIERRYHDQGAIVAFDATHVHNLGNLGPSPATSIHAYSPPLPFMRFYEPDAAGRLHASYQLAVDGPEPDDTSAPMPVGDSSAPMPVGDSSAPMPVGDSSAPMPVGDSSAPIPVGDSSAPIPVGDSRAHSGLVGSPS